MEFTTDVLDEEEVTAQETAEELSLTTNIYAEIRARLALRGIPRGEVAFIHDARTPAARKALFEAVNNGRDPRADRLDREDGHGHERAGALYRHAHPHPALAAG